jgi:hypothetical protein
MRCPIEQGGPPWENETIESFYRNAVAPALLTLDYMVTYPVLKAGRYSLPVPYLSTHND